MADNVSITEGAGTSIAADDIAGVKHQRVKISLGADGSATDAVSGAGAVDAGTQRVTLASDDPATASLAVIDDWDDTDACKVVGNVDHDSADSGKPVKVGGVARTDNPTAVAAGDRVSAMYDKTGRAVSVNHLRENLATQKTTISSTSETTIVTAAGAGVFADIYRLIISNTSGSATTVTIKDSTTGTTRYILFAPSGATVGFSGPVDGATKQATANNNWTATISPAVTSIEITVDFVKNV